MRQELIPYTEYQYSPHEEAIAHRFAGRSS